ncbi:recombinase family protein [Exiguobacterium sp. SH4S7]|uniref:recombinase family protein n=1 Tax=Exiguobacterium sp. SH4S7 TaxID=2510958 RepID=UPI00104001D9|nr:recombinase family protein [Exiguobacterium sp. SH4S7]TCI32748.1 recombinase family protein [Exiguobacterium sp. SH4S7]
MNLLEDLETTTKDITGRKVAYIRVSTEGQRLDRQREALEEVGCTVFYEEKISGTIRNRPELNRMIDELQEGDTVYIVEISRLSRSSIDLQTIVKEIGDKKAHLISLNDRWLDTTSPSGQMIFTVMSAVVQFERDMISQRTKDGMKSAKKKGSKIGRPKLDSDKVRYAIKLYVENLETKQYSVNQICKLSGVSKPTLYKKLREKEIIE